jgi:hypothetical protein
MADNEALGVLLSKIVVDLADMKKNLSEGRRDMQSFKTMAADVGGSVKKALAFAGVAVGIYEIASALKSFAQEAAMVGARTETLDIAMQQVGKTYGVSAASLKFYVDELKGAGITDQESMTAVTKALTTGIPLDQLKDLATRARDIAVVAGINTSEALNRMMQGIISGEQETLRRLMIQVGHTDDIYKRFAATLGKTKEELNSVEKTQAMLNEVMRLSAGFAGTAAAADASVGKQLQSMARFAQEAKNALWALFEPVMSAGVQEMTQGWKNLKTWADANQASLKRWGQEGAAWLKWLATGIRDIGAFIAENKNLIKTLLELYVASKAAGWIAGMGSEIKKTTVEVGILAALLGKLKALIGGPWRIVITVALFGLYEAWNAIQRLRQQAGFTPQAGAISGAIQEGRARDKAREAKELDIAGAEAAREAERRGISTEKYLELAKEEQRRAIKGRYKKYTAPSVLPAVLPEHETPAERAEREARAAHDKALADAPKALDKDKKGGGGKESIDSLLAPMLAMYKAKREAELQDAQNSLELLKSTNDKKRAELEKDLAEGVIDGQTYYQRLQELQQQETTAALAMIEKKKVAQAKAYQESLTEIEADPKMSDEAKSIARQKMAAENQKTLSKLALEGAQAKLDGEVKVTNELKRQVEVQKQFTRTVEDLENAIAWGPIEEQEAKLRQLYLEWQRAKGDALDAGASPDLLARMDTAYQGKMWAASPEAEQAKGLAGSITSSFSSLVDSLSSGTTDLKTSLNSMFKGVFNEALKPGLKSLEQLLMNGFKELFGAVGGAVGSAIMGVIGLAGMLLTSSSSKSFSSSGVTSNVTSSEAVRGIIAGETSIPIAEISLSLSEAVAPHLSVLQQIEANTRGGGRGTAQVNVNYQGNQENRATTRESMEAYFREYLLMGAGAR